MKVKVPVKKSTAIRIKYDYDRLSNMIIKCFAIVLCVIVLCFICTMLGLVIGVVFVDIFMGVKFSGFNEAITSPVPCICAILFNVVAWSWMISEFKLIEFEYISDDAKIKPL